MSTYLTTRRNLERDIWDEFFRPTTINTMKTDITETDSEYLMDIEIPGYNKEDVKISLDDGYLTIEAVKNEEQQADEKNYVRRERYMGKVSRSWYVGNIDQSLIHASFNNGILTIGVPKEQLPLKDNKNYIEIQ